MSVTGGTSSQTKFFSSGEIKFSELRTTFNSNAGSNNIKFSTYRRNTDLDETDPIVPDSTENRTTVSASEGISTQDDLKIVSFRNSIKQYVVTQSSSNTEVTIHSGSGAGSRWNANLDKNVKKFFNVNGTIDADSPSDDAAVFDAEAYNLTIDVTGNIYGEGGTGGSANYGQDPYLNNVSLLVFADEANGSTSTTDYSPNTKTITFTGNAQVSSTQSKFGGSSLYSGSGYPGGNDIATNPSNDFAFGTDPFTIEFWYWHGRRYVGTIEVSNGGAILLRGNATPGGGYYPGGTLMELDDLDYYILVGGNISSYYLNFYLSNGNGSNTILAATTSPSSGGITFAQETWNHIVLTRESDGHFYFYINGVKTSKIYQDDNPITTRSTELTTTAKPLFIGGYDWYGSPTINTHLTHAPTANSFIDDIRITKGIARYTEDFTPPTIALGLSSSNGGGAGGNGGDALYVNNTSSRSGNSAKVIVKVNSNGRIWAGGGGGAAGGAGNTGNDLNCYNIVGVQTSVYSGGSTNPGRACNRNCPKTLNILGTGYDLDSNGNCFNTSGNRSRCRQRQERGQVCANDYSRNCNYKTTFIVAGGNGGNGGNGGVGEGANNNKGNGNDGNAGNTNNCSVNSNSSTGNDGNPGASGGTWGVDGGNAGNISGGTKGRAVFRGNGNTFFLNGQSSNNVKGTVSGKV